METSLHKILTFLIALGAVALVNVSAVQAGGYGYEGGAGGYNSAAVGGGCTTSTFDKDGTPQAAFNGATATLTSPAFSTSFCNDLVTVIAGGNGLGVSTVVDTQGHLTFTKNVSSGGGGDF